MSRRSSPRRGAVADVPAEAVPDAQETSTPADEVGVTPSAPAPEQAVAAPLGPVVVGIGASAGGLEALRTFVSNLPETGNLAYVIVQHLSPTHKSMLVTLLARESKLQVLEVEDGVRPQANTIYVTPIRSNVRIEHGRLLLSPADRPAIPKPSVDEFLISLADDQGEHAVGIVLSGTGADGARGIRAVFAAGGITFAQEEASAKYSGMPHAAIETGCVSYILPPDQIARKLGRLQEIIVESNQQQIAVHNASTFDQICALVKRQVGVDLTVYKDATMRRRLRRRMVATESGTVEDYLALLHRTPIEINRLAQEILISVTSFFREPSSFAVLAGLIETIVARKRDGEDLRIWIPGCATGEEAYSIAILVAEALDKAGRSLRVQIFATDIDTQALSRARRGVFSAVDIPNVPKSLTPKHLVQTGEQYRISKRIRELIIYSVQNLTTDPPFLRLDLISCRNVLIYFRPEVQQRIMEIFSYSLNTNGYLFLGKSESTFHYERLFAPVNEKARIYQRLESTLARPLMDIDSGTQRRASARETSAARERQSLNDRVLKAAQAMFMPAAVVVDDRLDLKHVYGDIGSYVKIQPGEVNLNLYAMAVKDLRVDIRSAVIKAQREPGKALSYRLHPPGQSGPMLLGVMTLPGDAQERPLFLITFNKAPGPRHDPAASNLTLENRDAQISALEEQLSANREHLQTVIEELETSNEELQSLNEELQSANEELQSTNEELETTNEELQSANEELTTVNDELKAKTLELIGLNNDLQNVRDSLAYPLIVVDDYQRVVLFNPAAQQIFDVSTAPIGQVLHSLPCHLDLLDLRASVMNVINTGAVHERQINSARCYAMNIRPYIDDKGRRHGAVLSFVENTETVRAEQHLIEANQRLAKAERFFRSTFDVSPASICIVDPSGVVVEVNEPWRRFAAENGGAEESVGVGSNYLAACERAALTGDAASVEFLDGLRLVLDSKRDSFSMEYPCHSPQARRWYEVTIIPFRGEGARLVMLIHDNITTRKERERQLRLQSRALDASINGIIIADAHVPDFPLIYVNQAFEDLTGYLAGEVLGRNARFLFGADLLPDGHHLTVSDSRATGRALRPTRALLKSARKDGSLFWNELSVYPIDDEDGDIGYLVGVQRDMTAMVASEEALKASLEHERLAYAFAGVGTFEWDIRGGLVTHSETNLKLLGFTPDQRSSPYALIRNRVHVDDRAMFDDAVRLCLAGHTGLDLEYRVVWDNGQARWLHTRGDVKLDAAGLPKDMHGLSQDITERKEIEERVRYTALHDILTGLPNRTLLRDRLQLAVHAARRNRTRVAVMFIDLDHFKDVNDSLGHHVGDLLLQAVANRLKTCIREEDTLCRQSGDEYVIVLPDIHEGYDARYVAIKIVDALSAPFIVNENELVVTPSIGISIFPDDGDGIDVLMRNADSAMYRAKTSGRRNFQFFMPELDQRALDQITISGELRRALDRGELCVYYQPQLDVLSERIVGVEALVRWQHPTRGLVLPEYFIHVAETSDLLGAIDAFVLYEACVQAQRWHADGLLTCPIAVNFSPLRFRHTNIVDVVGQALKQSGLAPQHLELELTERAIIVSGEDATRTLRDLRGHGVRIALDDFGTGYSSLSYLTRFPIDKIKIDRSFISGIPIDHGAAAVVRAVIGLGRSLKLEVVAEGVETHDQLQALRLEQCATFQGYLASPAVSAEALTDYLRARV